MHISSSLAAPVVAFPVVLALAWRSEFSGAHLNWQTTRLFRKAGNVGSSAKAKIDKNQSKISRIVDPLRFVSFLLRLIYQQPM